MGIGDQLLAVWPALTATPVTAIAAIMLLATVAALGLGVGRAWKSERIEALKERLQQRDERLEALSRAPVSAPDATGAILRITFHGDNRLPTELAATNVANWFAYYTPHMVLNEDIGGDSTPRILIPKTWAIFIAYERPASVREIIVNLNVAGLPVHQVLHNKARASVISFADDIPAGVLEIEARA